MGCNSCSSGGCSPAGCGSKGHCASGGCNRLNVFDWLTNIDLPSGAAAFDIIEISFKGTRKEYYKNINQLDLYNGDWVAVEAPNGHDIGKVTLKGELVKLQLKKRQITENDEAIRKVYRIANETDLSKYREAKEKESGMLFKTRTIIHDLGLNMKLGDVEMQADKSKATFYYTADGRVDFRELIKVLAEEFKCRIEMRQIGARQEAGRVGGLGSCGRELCCSSWLADFKSVTTSAARYQSLSLNPLKLAGQCGRLKCCLNYELDTYLDALKDFPKDLKVLKGKKSNAEVFKTDIFKKTIWFIIPNEPDAQPFPLPLTRVNEIIAMNKKGEYPEQFTTAEMLAEIEEEIKEVQFETVTEDSLFRFDKKKKKKKKTIHNKQVTVKNTAEQPLQKEKEAPVAAKNNTPFEKPKKDQQQPNSNRNNQPQGQNKTQTPVALKNKNNDFEGANASKSGSVIKKQNNPFQKDQTGDASKSITTAAEKPENVNRNNNSKKNQRFRPKNQGNRPGNDNNNKPQQNEN